MFEDDFLLVYSEFSRTQKQDFLLFPILKKILFRSKKKIEEIKRIFFVIGPGSQSAIRISLTFVSVLQILDPKIEFWYVSFLLLSLVSFNSDGNGIVFLPLGFSKKSFFVEEYKNYKKIGNCKIVSSDFFFSIKKKFLVEKDDNFSFLDNFAFLKENGFFTQLFSVSDNEYLNN